MTLPLEVFISYHRKTDEAMAAAERLFDVLSDNGCKPFLDHRSIKAGDDWAEGVYGELFACDAAIVLVSRAGLAQSEWLAHEAAILVGRFGRWGDVALIPVLLDAEVKDLRDRPQIRALARVQCLPYDAAGDQGVDDIIDALKLQWQRRLPRLKRRRFFQALMGVSRRARAFQNGVEELLPADEDLLRGAITAAGLPLPPTDAEVRIQHYAAGLLLCIDRPLDLIAQLRERGAAREATALERYLGRRGLVPQANRFGWSLTRRFFWSLRRSVAAGAILAVPLAMALLYASSAKWGENDAGAPLRSLRMLVPFVVMISIAVTVLARAIAFAFTQGKPNAQ